MNCLSIRSLVWLLPLLPFAACGPKTAEQPIDTPDHTSSYRIQRVGRAPDEQELRFTGQVAYDESRVTRVQALVSGQVTAVPAALGAYVVANAPLATIRSADVGGYQDALIQARADLALAQKTAANTEKLYADSFASQTDLLAARTQLAKARSALARAQQAAALYGGSGAAKTGAEAVLRAPTAGYVVQRAVNPGTVVRADDDDPLFTISDLSKVWVMLNVYEPDLPSVQVGQTVRVTTVAYPDRTFTGQITNVSAIVDPATRVVRARVELPNPQGLLKPDMFCTVSLTVPRGTGQDLAIDPKALIYDEDRYFVVRHQPGRPDSTAYTVVPVRVLRRTSARAYLDTGAVRQGDELVTDGALLLYNDLTNPE